jgi:hypothetical protein
MREPARHALESRAGCRSARACLCTAAEGMVGAGQSARLSRASGASRGPALMSSCLLGLMRLCFGCVCAATPPANTTLATSGAIETNRISCRFLGACPPSASACPQTRKPASLESICAKPCAQRLQTRKSPRRGLICALEDRSARGLTRSRFEGPVPLLRLGSLVPLPRFGGLVPSSRLGGPAPSSRNERPRVPARSPAGHAGRGRE